MSLAHECEEVLIKKKRAEKKKELDKIQTPTNLPINFYQVNHEEIS